MGVVKPDEVFDDGHKFRYALEDTAPDLFAGDLPEPPFHEIQAGRRGRSEMQMKSRMLVQPLSNTGVGVGPVVVQDQMEIQSVRRFPVDRAEEVQELCVPVTGITGADQGAVEGVEGRAQAGGSIALVVMGHGPAPAFLHRQFRLGPVQGLNLRRFINAQDQRLVRGVQVDADDIGQLLHEPRCRSTT